MPDITSVLERAAAAPTGAPDVEGPRRPQRVKVLSVAVGACAAIVVFAIMLAPTHTKPRVTTSHEAAPPPVATSLRSHDATIEVLPGWHASSGGLYQATLRPSNAEGIILQPGCELPRGEKSYLAILRDGAHDYSVTYVLGKDAPPSRKADIERMLDSLKFDQ